MTAFVITAAGRGSRIGRVGDALHKCLVPLNGKAVLSHIFDLAPIDARIIVVVGHMADQVMDYVELAHPKLDVTFVHADHWSEPFGGPGDSLTAAQRAVGDDDLYFTSCDTLWDDDIDMWRPRDVSWIGIAPIPPGTSPQRWTTVYTDDQRSHIEYIHDKDRNVVSIPDVTFAWTGLGFIAKDDLLDFWDGINEDITQDSETQIVPGLQMICDVLDPMFISWTDVGDETSYAAAVSRFTGYDFVKYDQATYVLPEQDRVVKFNADAEAVTHRIHRATLLDNAVPQPIRGSRTDTLLALPYVPGVTAYDAIETSGIEITQRMLQWFDAKIFSSRNGAPTNDAINAKSLLLEFYAGKSYRRAHMLPPGKSRDGVLDTLAMIDYEDLIDRTMWGSPHGDFNYGNVIITPGGEFVGIDWREDFAGSFYGDLRYDLGKMYAGTIVHWQNAQHGDLRPWSAGQAHGDLILEYAWEQGVRRDDIRVIAGISLLNCAPLHAEPLCSVLIARGIALLSEPNVYEGGE